MDGISLEHNIGLPFSEIEKITNEVSSEDVGFSKWIDAEDDNQFSDKRRNLQSSITTIATCDCDCGYTWIQIWNVILVIAINGTIGCIFHVVTPFYKKKKKIRPTLGV